MFTQDGFGVRLEWGIEGVKTLGPHCTVLVIVDVLSFGTTVDLIVARGSRARPVTWSDGTHRLPRPHEVAKAELPPVMDLPSPNGATLSVRAAEYAKVLAGSLRNAKAVAETAVTLADRGPIGVIAAGEQWGANMTESTGLGRLRPSIEDQLGAGAIVSALLAEGYSPASPEAALAATTFRAAEPYLADLVAGCGSGLELAAKGAEEDIRLAVEYNLSVAAPVLVDGVFANGVR